VLLAAALAAVSILGFYLAVLADADLNDAIPFLASTARGAEAFAILALLATRQTGWGLAPGRPVGLAMGLTRVILRGS
jgi:hypothetical protein